MSKRLNQNDNAPNFQLNDTKGNTVTLDTFTDKSLALIFTRYVGCPVCQMDTIEYKKHYEDLVAAGLDVAMVFQSSIENLHKYAVQEILPFTTLSDPKSSAYKAYGVDSGLSGFLSVKNISPIVKSLKSGHMHGKFEGNEFQYPAAFIIGSDKKIKFAHYGKTVTDGLNPKELLLHFSH